MSGESSLASCPFWILFKHPMPVFLKNNNAPILRSHAILLATAAAATYGWFPLIKRSTSTTALAKACGASCGRLCPMPPLMVRCEY
jgi:hypothetical protein